MRQKLQQQVALRPAFSPAIDHPRARELEAISDILDAHPQVADIVLGDLPKGQKNPNTGRRGMPAEQVLRALIIKQMNGFSYEELAFHLLDSQSYKEFCRIDPFRPPSKSALADNIKRISAATLEEINRLLVMHARVEGVEKGRKARFDCTPIEANIHEPTDGELLWDVVRVLARLMRAADGDFAVSFRDRTRRAKRRARAIWNAKNEKKRRKHYLDLLAATNDTLEDARRVARALREMEIADFFLSIKADGLVRELEHFIALGVRVEDQAHRRIVYKETVPAAEKLVSIFEEHADIIVKDRREPVYGHKICLATGASGLVLDLKVLDGNPADSTLTVEMLERQEQLHGRVPRQAAFDGGFSSHENLKEAKALGVEDVCFSKGRGLKPTDMARSEGVYRKLRDFRAGIEGGISFLKRCFGWDRCTWRGLESFHAYTWASVVAANLLVLARHALAAPG